MAIGPAHWRVEVIVPGEREQGRVARLGRAGVKLLQAFPQVVDEPGVGAAVEDDRPTRVAQAGPVQLGVGPAGAIRVARSAVHEGKRLGHPTTVLARMNKR